MRTVHHRRFLILGPFEYFDHSGNSADESTSERRDAGRRSGNIARYIHAQEAAIAIAGTRAESYSRWKARAEKRCRAVEGSLKFFMDSRQIRSMKRPPAHNFAAQEQPGLAVAFGPNEAAGRVLASVPQSAFEKHRHSTSLRTISRIMAM
jgi:hypothetical protein